MFNSKRREKKQTAILKDYRREKEVVWSQHLQWGALHGREIGVGNDRPEQLIVSLTTFNKRIEIVYLTIESLFNQSLKPDRILLWVSREEFVESDIPALLRLQQARGLEVCFCPEDLGPYKKFYYTLQAYPDSLIVTVDDDVLYPPDMLDQLYRSYQRYPDTVIAHRAHCMALGRDGRALPYKQWDRRRWLAIPSLLSFPTGIGGVLYPPGCFADEVLDKHSFRMLCHHADDIWLKAMTLKNGTPSFRVPDRRDFASRFITINQSQQFSLKRVNKHAETGNDAKIKTVFEYFDLWPALRDAEALLASPA